MLDGVVDLLRGPVQLLRGEAAHPIETPLVAEHQGADVGQLFPPVEGENDRVALPAQKLGRGPLRVLGPLLREQGQHHLLRRVVVALRGPGEVGRLEVQLHGWRSLVSLRPTR